MVFTVKEFVKSQDIDVEALCSQLDAELVKKGQASISLFNWAALRKTRDIISNKVTALYRDVGWQVKRSIGDDQRDGSWDSISVTLPAQHNS